MSNKAAVVLCLRLCGLEPLLKAQRFCSTVCQTSWPAYSVVLVPNVQITALATWKLICQLDGETVNLMQPRDAKQIILSSKFSNLLPVHGKISLIDKNFKKDKEEEGRILHFNETSGVRWIPKDGIFKCSTGPSSRLHSDVISSTHTQTLICCVRINPQYVLAHTNHFHAEEVKTHSGRYGEENHRCCSVTESWCSVNYSSWSSARSAQQSYQYTPERDDISLSSNQEK